MICIEARNVNDALIIGLDGLQTVGIERESRNGPVVMYPTPVSTVYFCPWERVIFWPGRDANPFLHFFESLWMLGGRKDLAYLELFTQNMRQFSDDGETLNGAYGWRWRHHFEQDQILWAIERLKKNPDDRRVHISMWDPRYDVEGAAKSKDVPCNVSLTLQLSHHGHLELVVFNRSNDIIWGAYGANVVHFSFMHQFVAEAIGVPVGNYWQVSANFHAYRKVLDSLLLNLPADARHQSCPYKKGEVQTFGPLISTNHKTFLEDLSVFLDEGPIIGFREPFFRKVATPLWSAHRAYKENIDKEKYTVPLEILQQCKATDWRKAAEEWIQRRAKIAGYPLEKQSWMT